MGWPVEYANSAEPAMIITAAEQILAAMRLGPASSECATRSPAAANNKATAVFTFMSDQPSGRAPATAGTSQPHRMTVAIAPTPTKHKV
jgi:hypothetical protein